MPSDFELQRAAEGFLDQDPEAFERFGELIDSKPNGHGHEDAPFPEEAPSFTGTEVDQTTPLGQGVNKGFSIDLVISATDLAALDIPEREELIQGVLHTQSLAMIFGPRGRGKTYIALSMANDIATATPFLAWKIPTQRRTLFVDGELPAADLKWRCQAIAGREPSSNLEFISSEFFYGQEKVPLTLNNEVHQKRFLLLLDALAGAGRKPEVIFFDNLSSMTYGSDENSNTEQDSFLRYLIQLRHLGYSVIFVHHAGRNGDQRGATRREDFLDLSLKLADPPEGQSCNARFILEFSKIRRKIPTPFRLECELTESIDGGLAWSFESNLEEIEPWIICLRYCQTMKPADQKEIGERLKIPKASVSRYLKDGRTNGYLEDLKITPRGAAFLAKIYGENE